MMDNDDNDEEMPEEQKKQSQLSEYRPNIGLGPNV